MFFCFIPLVLIFTFTVIFNPRKTQFYRQVTANDPRFLELHIRGGTTTWAVVTAIPNVNQDEPIRSVSETSCDFASKSVFPSVYGKENDVLLLSQSFDDAAEKSQFRRPLGTIRLGFTHSKDEVRLVTFMYCPYRYVCYTLNNACVFLSW